MQLEKRKNYTFLTLLRKSFNLRLVAPFFLLKYICIQYNRIVKVDYAHQWGGYMAFCCLAFMTNQLVKKTF